MTRIVIWAFSLVTHSGPEVFIKLDYIKISQRIGNRGNESYYINTDNRVSPYTVMSPEGVER